MFLGKTSLKVSKQGLGCMSMSEFYGPSISQLQAQQLVDAAYQGGVNFFDTADVYGYGRNETLLGKAIAHLLDLGFSRTELIIATKCGIVRDERDQNKRGIDNSLAYIKNCCENSLQRLGEDVGSIDLYYLHRIANNGAQIDEAMRAMAELLVEGKIKAVGLSEANAEMIEDANNSLLKYTNGEHQLAAVQSEYSLMTRAVEENGVLACCRRLGITFIAYSPLSRALLTGEVNTKEQFLEGDFRRALPRFQDENIAHNSLIINSIKQLAEKNNCSTAQIALAWSIHQGVIPIPGTTKMEHLSSNLQANNITLSEEDLLILNNLDTPKGYRYTEAAMKAYGFDDELTSEEVEANKLSSEQSSCAP